MRQGRKTFGFIGIIFALILFVSVNVLATTALSNLRFDFTAEKIYTLSGGTKNILKSLKEPIRLRYFYSRKVANGIPVVQSYAARVEGLLRQYARMADGNIILEFIDPEPFSPEEDLAVSFGVQGVPLGDQGDKLYFGLAATNSVDDADYIAFFDPEREAFLEYDLTKMINDLSRPEKPVVGILGTYNLKQQTAIDLPILQGFTPPSFAITGQIQNNFEVMHLDYELSRIPDEVDVLMVVHPKQISDDTQYAIDQFVLGGGEALIFVDPHDEGPPKEDRSSNLQKLFSTWGIEMPDKMVVIDRQHGVRVQMQDADSRLRVLEKLNWLALPQARLDRDDVITGELRHMRVGSSGHIVRVEAGNVRPEFTPLVRSSENVMVVPGSQLDNAKALIQNFEPRSEELALAGRLQGPAVSAFPEREGQAGHISRASEPINVVIFADSDLLRDDYWVQKKRFYGSSLLVQISDNASFVMNALDNLSGSKDLISLRSRSRTERPFNVVAQLRREAEARFLEEEQRLTEKLKETEEKIAALRQGGEQSGGPVLLSREQQMAVERFQQEVIKTRKALRDVQHELRKEIEGLGNLLKFINIGLLPILVIMLSFFMPAQLGIRKK
jgi:ABC-type uncharacterized transport system involved in gliding motility auxiliary subunit